MQYLLKWLWEGAQMLEEIWRRSGHFLHIHSENASNIKPKPYSGAFIHRRITQTQFQLSQREARSICALFNALNFADCDSEGLFWPCYVCYLDSPGWRQYNDHDALVSFLRDFE